MGTFISALLGIFISSLTQQSTALFAPQLWAYETASVLHKAVTQRRICADQVAVPISGLWRLGVELVPPTEELLAQRNLKELLEVRKEMIREAVFNSLNLQLGAEGVEDPENTNGSIPVPELGKRLSREACGPKDPKLNEEKLEIDLGEERWLQVCEVEEIPEQVIPAHTQYTLSVERLMKLAESDLSILEIVRDCLEVGGYKTPRFFVRNL